MKNEHMKSEFTDRMTSNLHILKKICRLYGIDEEDRQDLFQEILGQLWKSYPSFEGRSEFSTWLYRVALNTAFYHLRKSRKQNLSPEMQRDLYHTFQGDKSLIRDLDLLYRAINKLSKVDRAIVLLYLEQKSYREMGEIMGLTRTHVSVKLVRAKDRLLKIYNAIREHEGEQP